MLEKLPRLFCMFLCYIQKKTTQLMLSSTIFGLLFGLALLFVHSDIMLDYTMPLLTNFGNRIVGYSFVSRPRPIKWNAFGSGAS